MVVTKNFDEIKKKQEKTNTSLSYRCAAIKKTLKKSKNSWEAIILEDSVLKTKLTNFSEQLNYTHYPTHKPWTKKDQMFKSIKLRIRSEVKIPDNSIFTANFMRLELSSYPPRSPKIFIGPKNRKTPKTSFEKNVSKHLLQSFVNSLSKKLIE